MDKPIDMLLHCPACGVQHIDKPDDPDSDAVRLERHRALHSIRNPVANVWTNPPHRSHLCKACGCIWRPADVCTNGVEKITTRGVNDTWPRLPNFRVTLTYKP